MIRRIVWILAASALLFSACNKSSDDDTTYQYLNGTLRVDLPNYVDPGATFKLTPTGVTHPEDLPMGYYWRVSWRTVNDTTKYVDAAGDGTYVMKTPDNVGSYTVTGAAYAPSYVSSTTSVTMLVVKADLDSTVSRTGIKLSDPYIFDSRNNLRYYTAQIGGKTWFRQNLAYSGSGVPFENSEVMGPIFGCFYTWDEARKACPAGWHLSTAQDWLDMAVAQTGNKTLGKNDTFPGLSGALMPDALMIGERLWEYFPAVAKTNSTGFAALPSGYAVASGSNLFAGATEYAVFWTDEALDDLHAWYRYIRVDSPDVMAGTADKASFLASVRCVKD